MYDIILGFITAFVVTYFTIPSIIQVSNEKHLFDEPGDRRSHSRKTPSLGGIGIFAGLIFSIVMWTPFKAFGDLQYILCAYLIMFLIGVKDDIIEIRPRTKLVGQIFAAFLLAYKSNIMITSLHGVFGIYDIPIYIAYPLTIFTIIVIINAFNLIDGINGLAGGITSLVAITLGTWFAIIDRMDMAIIAFCLVGAIFGFLHYNFRRYAMIFMGDTGSLLLGLTCSILAINFIEHNDALVGEAQQFHISSGPAVAIGILILPLFDTARVFATRIVKGKSPFYPDRTHIHHLLIDSGLTHLQSTGVLILVNILFIVLVLLLQKLGTIGLLFVILSISTFLSLSLYLHVQRRNKRLSKK